MLLFFRLLFLQSWRFLLDGCEWLCFLILPVLVSGWWILHTLDFLTFIITLKVLVCIWLWIRLLVVFLLLFRVNWHYIWLRLRFIYLKLIICIGIWLLMIIIICWSCFDCFICIYLWYFGSGSWLWIPLIVQ